VTSVSYRREGLLVRNADLMKLAFDRHAGIIQFKIIAYVIMPDHFHALIDCNGNDLSKIMSKIKLSFSKYLRNRIGVQNGAVWQRRFWDHIIRNQNDMNRHIDYIHINPVKHGLVNSPLDWKYSSFHEYFRAGYYSPDWGRKEIDIEGDFGE
jgi:putative transposase